MDNETVLYGADRRDTIYQLLVEEDDEVTDTRSGYGPIEVIEKATGFTRLLISYVEIEDGAVRRLRHMAMILERDEDPDRFQMQGAAAKFERRPQSRLWTPNH